MKRPVRRYDGSKHPANDYRLVRDIRDNEPSDLFWTIVWTVIVLGFGLLVMSDRILGGYVNGW
jgi:hypothetical protein